MRRRFAFAMRAIVQLAGAGVLVAPALLPERFLPGGQGIGLRIIEFDARGAIAEQWAAQEVTHSGADSLRRQRVDWRRWAPSGAALAGQVQTYLCKPT
jgi:hypothetical protein